MKLHTRPFANVRNRAILQSFRRVSSCKKGDRPKLFQHFATFFQICFTIFKFRAFFISEDVSSSSNPAYREHAAPTQGVRQPPIAARLRAQPKAPSLPVLRSTLWSQTFRCPSALPIHISRQSRTLSRSTRLKGLHWGSPPVSLDDQ